MKRILLILFMAISVLCAGAMPASAAWEITASWTASTGPNLAKEELIVGAEVIATIQAGAQTAATFVRPTLSGEVVKVVSYNTTGVPNAGYILGTLEQVSAPAAASGGAIIIRWKP